MTEQKAILWDNDGVLVDTEKWFFEANRRELAALGVEVSWEDFEAINLRRGESLLPLSGLEGDELSALYARRDKLYSGLLRSEETTMPGMQALLRRLRARDFRMGIVTSCHREHFEIIHAGSGILAHVDFVLCNEDYVHGKPHPDGYLAGLRRTGVSVEDCLVVEDSPRGIAAARAAGLTCLFFTPGGMGAERQVGKVRGRAASVKELEEAIVTWAENAESTRAGNLDPTAVDSHTKTRGH
jgi:HAD superfamily hydrolase (TIGR01509 family)